MVDLHDSSAHSAHASLADTGGSASGDRLAGRNGADISCYLAIASVYDIGIRWEIFADHRTASGACAAGERDTSGERDTGALLLGPRPEERAEARLLAAPAVELQRRRGGRCAPACAASKRSLHGRWR